MKSIPIITVIFIVLVCLSYVRNSLWKNEYTLWSDVINKSPNKIMPHVNLGNAFLRRNAIPYAEKEFNFALRINPRDTRALNGLAVIYLIQKNYDEAIRLFEILASDKPDEAPFYSNLGAAYMEKGLLDEAITKFIAAIKADTAFPDAYANLGLAYKKKGMLMAAKKELEKALQLSPEHGAANKTLNEVMILLQSNSHRRPATIQ